MIFLKNFVVWAGLTSAVFAASTSLLGKAVDDLRAPVIREDISCLENARVNKLTLLMHSRRKLSLLCTRLKKSGYSERAAKAAIDIRWVVLEQEAQDRYDSVLDLCESARGEAF